jgi:LysM repeat protein
MEKTTSSTARLVAALALVVAVLALVVVVASSGGGDDDGGSGHQDRQRGKEASKPRTKAKAYVVETGDTLTAIARKTGVPVPEILALNPEVDPQILDVGQTLKLK